MRKAYDIILSDYVDADTAALSGSDEKYRYECACCGEEVYLCAADSDIQATHFRHRIGNNNIECDNYLGNRYTVISNALSRRNIRDKIEFYFSFSLKVFSIGIKFSADEISAFEQKEASFQVRSSYAAKPMNSVPIKRSRFYPNAFELIPITNFSWKYYVSSSSDSEPLEYEVFRKDKRGYLHPSFFKIQAEGDDNDFIAKLVRKETLYTNTPYLILFTHPNYNLSFQDDVQIGKVIKFRTMDRDFSGVVVSFTEITARIEQQIETWKYKLVKNETLTLLWPPSSQVNESILINTEYVYMFSSFELLAHGNINVQTDDIVKLNDGISKVLINSRVKIYNKNAEFVIEKSEKTPYEYDDIIVKRNIIKKQHFVSDDNEYLFNHLGVSPLSKGMSVLMTHDCEVRQLFIWIS